MKILNKVLLLLGLICAISYSCKDAGSSVSVSNRNTKSDFPINIEVGGTFNNLDALRGQVNVLIEDRKAKLPDPLAFITYAYWYPEFVFNGKEMSKEHQYLGYWLKFEDNFTYSYGQYNDTHGSGKYHFRLDDNSLLMLDNNSSIEPKVFIANHNGEAIALVGQHDYGMNNGLQMKLIPLDTKPVK